MPTAWVRVGGYVDGFNLHYGARGLCGRGAPGWHWLDLRSLAADLVARRASWAGAQIDRVVYCTARIDGAENPSGHADQDVYLKALLSSGSADHIEYGTYVSRVKSQSRSLIMPNACANSALSRDTSRSHACGARPVNPLPL